MGVSNSKAESCEALRLCKERKKFIKQAIDSRSSLAAAHVAYVQSLRNIGIALRKFAEVKVSLEPSSATDAEKTPSHSSHPSPSPPQICCIGDGYTGSPLPNVSPRSPNDSRLSYMKSGGVGAVTVNLSPSKISSSNKVYVEDVESLPFMTMPPPPPPPPPLSESGSSWDYFDPTYDNGSLGFVGHNGIQVNFTDMSVHEQFNDKETDLEGESVKKDQNGHGDGNLVATHLLAVDSEASGTALICKDAQIEQSDSKDGCLTEGETEDPSEFITHRAKDFLSSIKDIENHFFKASRSGKEVARMLEANKILVGFSDSKGSSTSSSLLHLNCYRGNSALVSHEPPHMAKVITWKRSMSSPSSSSSRIPPGMPSNDDNPPGSPSKDDDGSNFMEEFCMIAGSHSSTLDRLYAWERKLYDEVKASESIRKEYDRKCDQLRHQFTKDLKAHVIDKTRAVVKDLHSRIRVALYTVDSISKRIEKMRDEELQPQLIELIQGLIRMWKSMLECHHAQFITISLAYHSKVSGAGTHHDETKSQIMAELHHEIECFGLSFTELVKCYTSYVESINSWLQNRITQPKERIKGRRAFSPRRLVAPPIFVICRDWSAGIRTLPSQKLIDVIKDFLSHLHRLSVEELEKKQSSIENGDVVKNEEAMASSLSRIHSSLTKVLDRLTKFSEASLKMHEDTKQKCENARNAYSNYRPPRAFSL